MSISEKQVLERIARVEELSGAMADVVVGLTREQYAQNVLSIEQESLGADFLRTANDTLMNSMANIMALKMLVQDQRKTVKVAKSDLVAGARKALEFTVDEYLAGFRRATNEP